MICPKCGEVNSSNFLFCGMCGTIIEPARRATIPAPPVLPRAPENRPSANDSAAAPAASSPKATSAHAPAGNATPSISGPSLLGLGGPHLDPPKPDQPKLDQSKPGQWSMDPSTLVPAHSVDDLRDRAFSGLASYGHPDEPKTARKKVLLTVVLLAGLAGAGWWTYTNYVGVADNRKPTGPVPIGEALNTSPADSGGKQSEKNHVNDAPGASTEAPPETSWEASPETSNTTPAAAAPVASPAVSEALPSEAKKSAKPEAENTPKRAAATPAPIPARHEVSATRIPPPKAAPAADSGDVLFRRGESYLYGRNGSEDCGNALKYFKMASDKQHAKARSAMGTMYATGHCVTRDLPSSYRWFALALRVDPNNSIVEKNLSAVWNQMTPPERQLAIKSQ